MVFSSAVFLLAFLPASVAVYYLSRLIFKNSLTVSNVWLLIVSLVFYAWGEPVYILLMIASVIANYLFGLCVSTCPKTKKGKGFVALSCVFNLGLLFLFKYLGWIFSMFHVAGGFITELALPIGISFYTFQALSYVIDVYRGKDKAQRNIINVGLYIAFFPQLIAGPIVRYGTVAEQLKHREHTADGFSSGAWRFCIGLSKKILLANQLAVISDLAFGKVGNGLSVVFAWAGALACMLQIYFDFSGYSDMAIGLGRMFGFRFNENFNYPYISKSITEYWRRWHISLGEWFRDYLYYPLSLGPAIKLRKKAAKKFSRKTAGIISTVFVLFITWMATGIWHGANWTFVVWGFIQFICIFIEQYKKPLKNKTLDGVLGFCTTMLIVLLTKVIFKSDNMGMAVKYYTDMIHLSGNSFVDSYSLYWLGQYKVVLIAGVIFSFPIVEKITELCKGKIAGRIWSAVKFVALMLMTAASISYAVGGGYNPFIYFNF